MLCKLLCACITLVFYDDMKQLLCIQYVFLILLLYFTIVLFGERARHSHPFWDSVSNSSARSSRLLSRDLGVTFSGFCGRESVVQCLD